MIRFKERFCNYNANLFTHVSLFAVINASIAIKKNARRLFFLSM
jgi:hypothetical protein